MDITGITAGGRFKIIKKFSEGGMSSLYQANDTTGKLGTVAVKILKKNVTSNRVEDIIRFKSEAVTVSRLEHPNIVAVHEVGEILDLLYIAMDYVDGTSLAEIVDQGALPVQEVIEIILQVAGAIDYVHGHGVIHRDLKPGNIMVNEGTVKLIDFGLSRIKEYTETACPEEISGTLGYISPEQTGVLKRAVDERSDLYSLGIIFYQMLTGSLPFQGEDICSMIHHHIALVPLSPDEINKSVPAILSAIVLKLLEKEPENRYQSARGLIRDLEKYTRGSDDFVPGLDDRSLKLSYRTRLVGREKEIDELKEVFEKSKRGTGGLCFIGGEAGRGKTRLVEELRDHIYSRDGLLIDGKCPDQRTKVPYGPFRDALDFYVRNFSTYPEKKKEEIRRGIRDELGDLSWIIVQLNPLMKEIIDAKPRLVSLKPNREHKRFLIVASQFFFYLSRIEKGLVVLLDDLQWADDGTFELLFEISENIKDNPLVIIGTYRDNEVSEDHSLGKLLHSFSENDRAFVDMHLDNFSLDDMNHFVAGLLFENEKNTGDLAKFILKKSNGNPFFAIDIVKQLIDEKVIVNKENSWSYDAGALDSVAISSSIVDIIFKKIQLLDDKEKTILSYAAIIGKKFDLNILFSLGDQSDAEVVAIVDKAISLHILEADPQQRGVVMFVHDRIKEAFYENIPVGERSRFHIMIAETLEEIYSDNIENVVFDLALHYSEGGNCDKSLEYAYPAGLMAKENYANEDAVRYFSMVLELLVSGYELNDPDKRNLWKNALTNIGEIYLTIGEYDNAIEVYGKLINYASTVFEKVYINRQLSQIYFKMGDWQSCENYARLGLELLHEKLPKSITSVVLHISRELVVHFLHVMLPAIFIRKKEKESAEQWKNVVHFVMTLGWNFVLSDVLKYVHSVLRGLNISESKIGPSDELGMMMTGYATICSAIPFFTRSIRYHKRALKLRKELQNPYGIAQTNQLLGFALNWKGDYKESIDTFNRSIELFKQVGDIREIGMSHAGLIHNYRQMADYGEMKKSIDTYSSIATKTMDVYGMSESFTYSTPYYLETGRLDKAEASGLQACRESLEKNVLFTHCRATIELGRVYLEKGDIRKAIEYLEKGRDLFESKHFLMPYTIYLYTHLAEAYIADYSLKSLSLTGKERTKYRKMIKKTCTRAVKKTEKWISHHGNALIVMAKYYALRGKDKKAENNFQEGIATCKKLGQRYNHARALYEYGLYLTQRGAGDGAREKFEESYGIFSEIEAALFTERLKKLLGIDDTAGVTTAIERLVDKERLASVVKMSRELAEISDPEALLQETLDRSIEIAGAQRGCLFILNKKDKPRLTATRNLSQKGGFEYSTNVVNRVLSGGEFIITTNASQEHEYIQYKSITFYDLKSIICLPLKTRERILGILYLDNPLSSGVFTEKESELLVNFLSQAALAIEISHLQQKMKSGSDEKTAMVSSLSEEKLKSVLDYIGENYSSDISREGLASSIGVHPDHFGKIFKSYTGKKINEYINWLRINDASDKLKNSDDNIVDIAFSVGFESLRTFNRAFLKVMGVTPTRYREENRSK